MRKRLVSDLLGLIVGFGFCSVAQTEPLQHLEGQLLETDLSTELGSFSLDSEGVEDLRVTPGSAELTLHAGGTLARSNGIVNEARNVDPTSGRPRARGATGECSTGAEQDCLAAAQCIPVPGNPQDGCNAFLGACDLASMSVDVNLFEAINNLTIGFSGLDACAGALTLSSSLNVGDSATIATQLSNLLAGDSTGLVLPGLIGASGAPPPCTAGLAASGTLCNPLVPLSNDVTTGGTDTDGPPLTLMEAQAAGLNPTAIDSILYQVGLDGLLTDEQKALLGCGSFYGTLCDGHGISLLHSEMGVLFQSLLGFKRLPQQPVGGPLTTDVLVAQPGTVVFQGGVVCNRLDSGLGRDRVLPGCNGILDLGADGVPDAIDETLGGTGDDTFQPDYDTTTTMHDGTTASAGPNAVTFPAQPRTHPFTSQSFRSEMAVLSWNFVMAMAALSAPPGFFVDETCVPDPANPLKCLRPTDQNGDGFAEPKFVAVNEFDGTDPALAISDGFDNDGDGVIDNIEEGDPWLIGAFRLNGCSFAAPYACGNLEAFRDTQTRELADDPSGPPQQRWVWETGAEYPQTFEATGGFADFADWTFHGLGPEVSRRDGAGSSSEAGVLFVLGPPDDLAIIPDSSFVFRGPGPDQIVGTSDDPVVGLLYAVPEASQVLMSLAALAAAVGLAARRGSVRRRGSGTPLPGSYRDREPRPKNHPTVEQQWSKSIGLAGWTEARECHLWRETMRRRTITSVLALFVSIAVSVAGHTEPLRQTEGSLQQTVNFDDPNGAEIGSFTLESLGADDLRVTPGMAELTSSSGGTLQRSNGRANETRAVDPVTGRPLRTGGAACMTGGEAGCLPGSHCRPTEGGPDPADPCDVPTDLNAFRALNGGTIGFSSIDRSLGAFTIPNGSNVTGGATIATQLSNLLAGDSTGLVLPNLIGAFAPPPSCTAELAASGTLCNPLVPLSNDVTTGGTDTDGPPLTFAEAQAAGLNPTVIDSILYQVGLQGLLTDEQQALLGCGPFYGTLCDGHGIGLVQTEAGGLFQSLLAFEELPQQPVGGPLTTDMLVAQPGTVVFQGGVVCNRLDSGLGRDRVLPGCNGILDLGADGVPDAIDETLGGTGDDTFQPDYDTTTTMHDGTTTSAGPNSLTFPAQPRTHPFTSQFFRSEMAVLSWNFVMTLAALSLPQPDYSVPDILQLCSDEGIPLSICFLFPDLNGDGFADPRFVAQDEFDATDPSFAVSNGFDDDGDGVIDNAEEGDPTLIGAFRINGCSFNAPYACAYLQRFGTVLTRELEDDPSGPPQQRWVWETGAEYTQTDLATGDLSGFAEWTFHALGPEVSRLSVSSGEAGVLFVLGPPPEFGNLPKSPLIVSGGPGPDAIVGTADDAFVGMAYGAPSPVLAVEIDIKPGNDANPVNASSRGVVPVALLGSASFDVADVDVTTLAFGPAGAPLAHRNGPHPKDSNHDGISDLLAHFPAEEAGIAPGDEEVCVTGETLDGTPFEGCDAVRTVPPK